MADRDTHDLMLDRGTRPDARAKYSHPADVQLSDGEPFFLLRAQDLLAIEALVAYEHACRAAGLREAANGVNARMMAFSEWRRSHAHRVKLPD